MKISQLLISLTVLQVTLLASPDANAQVKPANRYDVAAYYWPAYHPDARFKDVGVFPDQKGEWEAVYKAKPKFDGHEVPKVPLWGYEDETSPVVMEKKIATAVKYGVNVMIFDWCCPRG